MTRKLNAAAAVATAALLGAAPLAAVAQAPGAHAASGVVVHVRNLVSDQPGHAAVTDPNLVNAWGMSHGPDTPLWVSDNGADVSTVYQGATGGSGVSIVPLVVKIPGGEPTGQVYNPTSGFEVPGTSMPAAFIFAGEGGIISAWNQNLANAKKVAQTPKAVYKGLAMVPGTYGSRLLAANFHAGRIDVFSSSFQPLAANGMFRDPHLPHGYGPFNIALVHGRVYVSYAKQDAMRHDDVAGHGHGFIDVFTASGTFVHRLVSRGVLNSPWGMVIAPKTFGKFAGKLLVGNFGDGRIHAFNAHTGALLGALQRANGHPVVIDGLWGLERGDSVAGGANTIWFSAGPNDEAHGLLGTLRG